MMRDTGRRIQFSNFPRQEHTIRLQIRVPLNTPEFYPQVYPSRCARGVHSPAVEIAETEDHRRGSIPGDGDDGPCRR